MKHLFLPSAVIQSCLPVLFRYSAIFVFVCFFFFKLASASMVLQTVKNRPTRWETLVRSLGQEDPMEKEMASHFSILIWRILWTEEPGGLQSMGSQRVGSE